MPLHRPLVRPLAPLLLFAAAIFFGACVAAPGATAPGAGGLGDHADAPPAGAPATMTGAGLEAASGNGSAVRAAIDAADLGDPATIDAVDAVRFLDGASVAAAAAIRSGVNGDALWAATWVYATVGVDPKLLRPVLTAVDPSTRALAAAAVLSWGDAAGASVLLALLLDEGRMSGSVPPSAIADYAAGSLGRYIAGPKVAAGANRAAVAAAWRKWIAAHGAKMRYSRQTGRWTAR